MTQQTPIAVGDNFEEAVLHWQALRKKTPKTTIKSPLCQMLALMAKPDFLAWLDKKRADWEQKERQTRDQAWSLLEKNASGKWS